MSRTIKFILLLIGFSFALNADAQLKQKPTWKISINPLNPGIGDEAELVLKK